MNFVSIFEYCWLSEQCLKIDAEKSEDSVEIMK